MDLLINLDVDDLDKAVRFYSATFGLKVGRRFGALGVEMLGSSAPIYLLVKIPGTLGFRNNLTASKLPAPLDAGPS